MREFHGMGDEFQSHETQLTNLPSYQSWQLCLLTQISDDDRSPC